MFGRIKYRRRRKKRIFIELLETLVTISLYLYYDGRFKRNPFTEYMWGHSQALKRYSEEMKREISEEIKALDEFYD